MLTLLKEFPFYNSFLAYNINFYKKMDTVKTASIFEKMKII